ncbi:MULTISPECIES: hypothetical protein [Deinococcus]|uniref:Transcriptional regulator n=1 Tax=Deinococcus rufus TaxID=2136097 RepID=A0ABV7ZCL7_9DEIO|nr:hypothetical protein [Deinococcus sp. AB2017081]WQE97445.1 hypothetical protein U2P90_20025 [Deinococcus sp. AB2017081]
MKLSRTTAVVFLMLSQTPQPVPAIAERLTVRGELLAHSEIREQLLRLAAAHLVTRTGAGRSPAYALAAGTSVEEVLDEAWRILHGVP